VRLPIFPDRVTHITAEIAFQPDAGKVYYFSGHLPVFVHEERDLATFRMFTSQLAINGDVTQAQISRSFGVPLVTVELAPSGVPSCHGMDFPSNLAC
jgi:hypothetical protein